MKTIMNVFVVIIATGLLTTNTNAVGLLSKFRSRYRALVLAITFGFVKCCEKIECDLLKSCYSLGRKNDARQCYCEE